MDEDTQLGSRHGASRWESENRYARADDRRPEVRRYEDHPYDHESFRAAPEAAPRTAETLDSLAGWIERAQAQLAQTADAANRLEAAARERRPAVEDGAFADALAAMRRIEERLTSQPKEPAPDRNDAEVDRTLRGLESRLGELTERLSAPRTPGRRPLKTGPQLKGAVDEIRTHQSRLERDPTEARRPTGLPALGTLARSQTAMLTTLKQEVAKLATRIEDIPHQRGADQHVQREVETMRRSMAEVARRDDLSRLERGLQALNKDIAELRRAGENASPSHEIASLQAEIRRLGEQRSDLDLKGIQTEIRRLGELRTPPVDMAPIARDIQNLSRKLDRVADGSVDPSALVSLSGQIEHVRKALSEATAPQALGIVDQQLSAIRREIAEVGGRQAGAHELEALRDTVEDLRASLKTLDRGSAGPDVARAVREFGQPIEQTLAALVDKVERVERRVTDPEVLRSTVEELRASLESFGNGAAGPDVARAVREFGQPIEQTLAALVDKVERVERRISDPEALRRTVEDLRVALDKFGNGSTGQDVARAVREFGQPIEETLVALVDKVERVERRVTDPEALRRTVEDLRASLDGFGAGSSQDVARAVREFGQPIELTLAALVDKVDRVERRVSDPDALDHLERQIQSLADRMGQGSGRDPAIASLERSMHDMLDQVASWRDGAVLAAEQAARSAVAETIDAMPVAAEVERHLMEIGDRYAAAEERTRQSLTAVHSSLSDVMMRLSSLETVEPRAQAQRPAAAQAPATSWMADAPVAAARPSAPEPRGSASSLLADADMPFAPPADDEVLLEPGSGRPSLRQRTQAPRPAPSAPADSPDIKSSFIAAARRAAQAAAAEAQAAPKPRPVAGPNARGAASGSDLVGRVRQLIDSKRRPLLLAAAAIVLAIGTMQIVRTQFAGQNAAVATAPVKPAAQVAQGGSTVEAPSQRSERAEVTAATTPAPPPAPVDPITTESITPETTASSPAAPPQQMAAAKESARAGDVPPAAPAAPPAPKAANLGDPSVVLPAGIKVAADRGNPVALYELAVRTSDGRGVARDQKAAVGLFEKAAEKGLAPAQYRLANSYERGIGVPRDLEQAKSWYRRAAQGGNVRAMHNLAVLLADGGGAKPDYAGAVEWFGRAAEHGVKDSQFNLAVLYARGLGTSQDLVRAYHWLAIASRAGDEDAGRKRDEVGQRLAPADLARAKAGVERWSATPAAVAANEVLVPPSGFAEPAAATTKRMPAREARV